MESNQLKPKALKQDDRVATLSAMTTASYSLDINLEKLMYCAIAVINKYEQDKVITPSDSNLIQISDETFYKLLYVDESKDYRTADLIKQKRNNIQKVRRIMQRAYNKFTASPVMEVYEKDSPFPSKVPMILKLHYDPDKKIFTMQLHKDFYDYFYDLGEKSFSSHTLRQIMSLDSYISLRLYRLFNSVKWRTNNLILDYDTIRKALRKEDKYQKHSHMKMIIDEAINEINSKTNYFVHHQYLKQDSSATFNAVEFSIEKTSTKTISKKLKNSLEILKENYENSQTPWSDDLSHFKSPERYKYFEAPTKLTPNQIKFLLTSDVFLNDYSFAYSGLGNVTKSLAQTMLKPLLQNELPLLNSHKKIDLDYYIAISYQKDHLK